MTRPVSQFKRIVEQLVLEVQSITTANGYVTNFKPNSVEVLPYKWKTLANYPFCFVTFTGGTKTKRYNGRGTRKSKIVRLVFFLRDSKVKNTIFQIADLETDLEYLFYQVNPYLKETATDKKLVTMVRILTDNASKIQGKPQEVYTVDLEVVYHECW